MSNYRSLLRTASSRVFLILFWSFYSAAMAQIVTGRISGTVKDASGAFVPGASLTAVNDGTQSSHRANSDDKGYYVISNLPVGTYTVTATLQGFKTVSRIGVGISGDSRITTDFQLEPGTLSEHLEVTSTVGEAVNTVSGEISRTIDARQVDQLALNGRNYLQLVSIIPGSALLNYDQLALTTSLSTGGQSINGVRNNSNNITVDGAYNLDAGANGTQINAVGLDFIQEVRTQTSNFSAEYGRQSGASINVITKSGTNDFHGSAFEFLRNDAFDARSFFAVYRPALRFNDFGWSLGGPILKNKLFVFGGQEWKRIRQSTTPTLRTLPTRAERAGDFSALSTKLTYPGSTTVVPNKNVASMITPNGLAVSNVYDRMESLAAGYTDLPIANNAIYQLSNPFDGREDLIRIDYRVNDNNSIYGRYMHDDYLVDDPFGSKVVSQLPTTPSNNRRPATSWQLAHTWTPTPTLVNEAKINAGWHGQRVYLAGDNWERQPYGFTFPELYSGGGYYPSGIPNVTVTGFSSFNGPSFYISTTTDISAGDTLTWVHGQHTVKAGFLFSRNRKDANGRPPLTGSVGFNTSGNSNSTGNAFADALIGNFRTYSEAQYDPLGMFRFSQYEAFVSDQWKVTPRLSVEMGLRLQVMPPAYATANNLTNFVASLYNPAQAVTVTSAGIIIPNSGNIYNGLIRAGNGIPADQNGRVPDATSPAVLAVPTGAPRGLYGSAAPVAPRFSFAWSPDANGRTSIRGGFGMFYDRIDETAIVQTLPNPPFAQTVQLENGNLADPTSGNAVAQSPWGTIRPIDPNLQVPYVMNYSLGIQRELPRGFFLEVSYVGNLQRHLMRQPDINMPDLSLLAANASLPTSKQVSTNSLRPYKGYSSLLERLSDANGNYNSLQTYLTKRKGWLSGTVSYTFSKSLADASSESESTENPYDRRFNYGPTSFDRRHIFVATFSASLPALRSANKIERSVLGGWELSGISHVQSGQYYTIASTTAIGSRRADYTGGDLSISDPTPSHYFNTGAFATAPLDRYGNSGSNIVAGPGLLLFDFSLAKNFNITERVNARFQSDAFNAFNHANFTGLNTNNTITGFGTVTGAGPGRNLQLGLKIRF